jgi:filamentous hemagglutinin family protein
MQKCIDGFKLIGTASLSTAKTPEASSKESFTLFTLEQLCGWHFSIALAIAKRDKVQKGALAAKHTLRLIALGMMSGAMTFTIASLDGFSGNRALAQITPDATLGAENSVVVPLDPLGLPVDQINGGAIRGANLFHSFLEFNVSEGRGAYFFSPNANIQNILARVTGANPSQILGTLGTFGNSQPNLFLINPNGIFFGENASLQVGGSFVATTANAIRLGNTGLFSASEPQRSNLLEVKPSAFFFNALANQAEIVNRSKATTTVLGTPTAGLQVPDGQSLLLVGGDVSLDGAFVAALGGRVELGGVAKPGLVGLNMDGSNLSLSFPDRVTRSNVSLTNGAIVFVQAGGGGSIAINAFNFNMAGESVLLAGIGSGLGSADSIAGNIDINATGAINLTDDSAIINSVSQGATGKGGDINITTGQLLVRDGSSVSVNTFGEGDSGNLTVNASQSVQLIGSADGRRSSGLYTFAESGSSGKGGDLTINTGSLLVRDGAAVRTSTDGEGDGGNLIVNASQDVQLIGTSADGGANGLFTQTSPGSSGKGGDLTINTATLLVRDGAFIAAFTDGEGDSGNLTVNASKDVQLIGRSYLLTSSDEQSSGKAGDVTINTGSLLVQDGAFIAAFTNGERDGGNLTVNASHDVQLIGRSADGQRNSGLSTSALPGSSGKAGDITINTGSLLVRDGAMVTTNAFGTGNGGKLTVNASQDVQLLGTNGFLSGLFALSGQDSKGNAGDVTINTATLLVQDGAKVNANTSGQGEGGNLTINASQEVQLLGESPDGRTSSSLASEAYGTGAAGNVSITTGRFIATDGAYASTSTYGAGRGGELTVNASELVELIGKGQFSSGLYTEAGSSSTGGSGNLTVNTPALLVRDGATVDASTAGAGKGGNLTVNASQEVQLLGESADGLSASRLTSEAFGTGAAGNVSITTGRFIATGGAYASTYTYRAGQGGEVTVNASEFVELIGSSLFPSGIYAGTEGTGDSGNLIVNTPTLLVRDGATVFTNTSGEGDAGDLTINTGTLLARDGGFVSVSTFGAGNGGNLTVNASQGVQLIGRSADSVPSGLGAGAGEGSSGNAGDVMINTSSLLVRDGARISARTQSSGNGGSLTVKASDSVQLIGADSGLLVNATAGGNAGSLTVETRQMSVSDGAEVTVSSPQGQAGDLTIQANSLRLNQGSLSAETAKSSAEGGANIRLSGLDFLRMDNESLISANALNQANGGNVTIDSTFVVATPPTGSQGSDITANAKKGNGGRVSITTQGLFGIELRPQLTPLNDITVSSESGLAGVFERNAPDVDPSRGLAELPNDVVDASRQIDRRCTPGGGLAQRSSFTVTGRGGLPYSPNNTLQADSVTTDWVTLDSDTANNTPSDAATPKSSASRPIVEAQGWMINEKGQVVLTEKAPTVTPHESGFESLKCDAPLPEKVGQS